MRLLFVSNYFPPFARGGYEHWCQEAAASLVQRGHEIVVLTSCNTNANQGERQQGVEVKRCLNLEAESGNWATAMRFFLHRKRHVRQNADAVRQIFDEFCPDAALLWGMWNVPRAVPYLVEELLPECVAYYLCDYWLTLPSAFTQYWRTPSGYKITLWPKRLLAQIALAQLAREPEPSLKLRHPICVSCGLRKQLVDAGLPLHQAAVIYGGIEAEGFAVNLEGQDVEAPTTESVLRILYVGRVTPDKGVHTALIALGLLAESYRERISLDIIGAADPGYRKYLATQVRTLGLEQHVRFGNGVQHGAMPSVMAKYDALVFPSEWHEPFARTPLEAMAAGLVVVGTTTGGTGEVLVHNETGLTFSAGDPESLAARFRQLVSHRDLGRALAARGQKTVRNYFTLQRMVDEIELYMRTMVEQGGP